MKNKLLSLLLLCGVISVSAQDNIIGFSEKASETQTQLEANFEKQLSADNLDQWMKRMAAEVQAGRPAANVMTVAREAVPEKNRHRRRKTK